eukprot:m.61965 g.61965  ORF g.61965 m.61965 type:complete len:175 (+) comp35034_c1_seq2:890-1414(+)
MKSDNQLPLVPDESSFDGSKYVTSNPESNVVLFRKLDTLSSEDTIRSTILAIAPLNIIQIRIVKDKLTNTSRGFCFIELDSIHSAHYLVELLKTMKPPFSLDGREVHFSFAKSPPVAPSFSLSSGIGPSLPQVSGVVSEICRLHDSSFEETLKYLAYNNGIISYRYLLLAIYDS